MKLDLAAARSSRNTPREGRFSGPFRVPLHGRRATRKLLACSGPRTGRHFAEAHFPSWLVIMATAIRSRVSGAFRRLPQLLALLCQTRGDGVAGARPLESDTSRFDVAPASVPLGNSVSPVFPVL